MVTCSVCNAEFADNTKLKRHQANIHDINVQWYNCDIENCEYKCKDKYNLKKHKANIHNINVQWYNCNAENCVLRFKSTSDLKRHQSAAHNINVQWFLCNLCEYKFKTKPNLDRHIRTTHNIGTIWYQCAHCEYKAKAKKHLDDHLARIHQIGVIWHYCDLCDYKSVAKNDLYTHKQNIHDINVKWHFCNIDNCEYRSKRNYRLKEHQGYRHDIGDQLCDYCANSRYRLAPFKDKHQNVHICRTCYRKATGKDSREEVIMSNYLDKHFGTEFLLGSDNRIYGDACQKYRPDKIYASPGIVLHIECDEHQHAYSGSSYECDEKRISDIYDEFAGNKYIVIRWNPDNYTPPKYSPKITRRIDKLELLLEYMAKYIQEPPKDMITIIYMFYDIDNPLITKNLPHLLV